MRSQALKAAATIASIVAGLSVLAAPASGAKPCEAIEWNAQKVKIGVIAVDCPSARERIEEFYERRDPSGSPSSGVNGHVRDYRPRKRAGLKRRTCGLLPGDGAYSYIRTWGIRCAPAYRIAFRARKRFCKRHDDCLIDPTISISQIHKGRVRYRGWRCRVKVGWELGVVNCDKKKRRLIYETAA